MRVKRGVTSHQRHAKVRKATKGMQQSRRSSIKLGRQAVTRARQYQYRDRRNKKRVVRSVWISRINAALKQSGRSYSKFMGGLAKSSIAIDRKILAELAVHEPAAFNAVADKVSK